MSEANRAVLNAIVSGLPIEGPTQHDIERADAFDRCMSEGHEFPTLDEARKGSS